MAVGIYFALQPYVGTEEIGWMCILGAAPFAACGFFTYHGMTAEQVLWAWFKSEILCPKRLVFKSDSYYYEAMQPAIRAGMKRKRGKPIIRIINGMISAIVGGMNAVIGLLNGFSFDVPEFAQDALGTAKIGFNIDPITAPQIPYLAQGAVIPANHEFLAVLGDQTNGTNVEAPLETIQQALAEVLAEWGGQDITIRFAASGGLEQLVRLLMPYIDKEKARRGARLVVGGN